MTASGELLERVDKLLIDMNVSIIKSDLTTKEGKEEAKKYVAYVLESGTPDQKKYLLDKFKGE